MIATVITSTENTVFAAPQMNVCDCNIGVCVVRCCHLRVFEKKKKLLHDAVRLRLG
jgi:hypothetical protein